MEKKAKDGKTILRIARWQHDSTSSPELTQFYFPGVELAQNLAHFLDNDAMSVTCVCLRSRLQRSRLQRHGGQLRQHRRSSMTHQWQTF